MKNESLSDLPRLKRTASVEKNNGHVHLRRLGEEVTLDGAAAEFFGRLHPHLDGKTPIDEMARKLSEQSARIRALVSELERVGLVTFASRSHGNETMSGMDFYALHRERSRHWLEAVYAHPLWEKIVEGKASRAQVLGFAFEKYHYIEAAFEHMGIAAANASPEMMPHLARHFIEEYTHGDIYRKGLRSLFPDDVILRSQPLPSTRALVNYLFCVLRRQ
jgi:hypothetical protein